MKHEEITFFNIPLDIVWNPERKSFVDEVTEAEIELLPYHSAELIDLSNSEKGYHRFMMVLSKNSMASLIHECWHFFFKAMAILDENDVNFNELSKEIYTYQFEKLVSTVTDIIEEFMKNEKK